MTGILSAAASKGKTRAAFIDAGTGGLEVPITGTLQVPHPATVAANNFLVMHVLSQDAAPSITTPAGWTLAGAGESPTATLLSKLFWKIAAGTEGGTNLNVTMTGGTRAGGQIYRFTGGAGIEAYSSRSQNTPSDTNVPAKDLTTLGSKRLAIQCLFASVNTTIGDITGESGADYTEAVAEFAAAAFLMSLQTAAVDVAAITGGNATLGSATTNKVAHGFAILPY